MRAHVVNAPMWVYVFKCLQLAIAVAVLATSAYAISAVAYNVQILALFTALATMIITIYYLVTFKGAPKAYNMWAVLALEVFAIIFWLVSMATLAYLAAALTLSGADYDDDYYLYNDDYYYSARSLMSRAAKHFSKRQYYYYTYYTINLTAYRNVTAVGAALCALNLVFFVVTLIGFSIFLHRHRKAGLPQNPYNSSSSPNDGVATTTQTVTPQKMEAASTAPQYHQLPAQQQQPMAPPQPATSPSSASMYGQPQQQQQQPYPPPSASPAPLYPAQQSQFPQVATPPPPQPQPMAPQPVYQQGYVQQ
ncbi:hypothetical protein BDY21DRAFT_348615 [Lineolata rhizophorae]|uniref:MARVEL domain-containing protein n=1 Tax=Lineolata rhizophorae TaxID=578093 RepID=A0A6A6NVF0_9PEZI|nr:hypothetical protein BDY21DRAFT_348615 [Lineolata rhizophorae]